MGIRVEGWERRLTDIIEAARHEPYVLGVHDCFRLACRVVETMTGVDRWPEFAGYTTEREALAALAAYGSSFVAAGDRFFGVIRQPSRYARRGDICGYQDDAGKWHLAVCIGADVALLGPDGLTFKNVSHCDCAWRIG